MCVDDVTDQFTQLSLTMETDYIFLTMETLTFPDDGNRLYSTHDGDMIFARRWKHDIFLTMDTLSFTDNGDRLSFRDDAYVFS
jgi:hypothetical protein